MFYVREKWQEFGEKAHHLEVFVDKGNAYDFFFERIGLMTISERKHKNVYMVDEDDNDIISSFDYWALISYMNDDIREQVHNELCPCSEIEFLKRYLELDHEFIETIRQEFSQFLEPLNM